MANVFPARHRRIDLLFPLALCILSNLAILILIGVERQEYLRDYRLNVNPDARHYVLLGRNIFLHGTYSRNQKPPFVPDVLRTPMYPLFAGSLELLGGPLLIYVAQIMLHVGICVLAHSMASSVFGRGTALIATLLVAVHPTFLVLDFCALSEMLFVFVLLLAISQTLRLLGGGANPRPLGALWAGLSLGLAILVRPAGLYLPVLISTIMFISRARHAGWVGAAWRSLVYFLGVIAIVVPWILRNQIVFDIPKLTTNDSIMLVYVLGASAYQVHEGVELEEAQRAISQEYQLRPLIDMMNYHEAGLSPKEMDLQLKRVIPEVLLRYPVSLIQASVVGLVKSYFSHDAGSLGAILGTPWKNPGRAALLRFESEAWSRLLSNNPLLTTIFFSQLGINALIVVLAPIGSVLAFRMGQGRFRVVLLLATFVFFLLIAGAGGYDSYSRYSAPSLPFACIFAGVAGRAALTHILRFSRRRSQVAMP